MGFQASVLGGILKGLETCGPGTTRFQWRPLRGGWWSKPKCPSPLPSQNSGAVTHGKPGPLQVRVEDRPSSLTGATTNRVGEAKPAEGSSPGEPPGVGGGLEGGRTELGSLRAEQGPQSPGSTGLQKQKTPPANFSTGRRRAGAG